MQRLSLALGFTAMVAAGAIAGCADDEESFSNRRACENWLDTYNALPCVEGVSTIDADTACSAYSDADTVDCSEIFNCWADTMACEAVAGSDIETINDYVSPCPSACE